MKSKYIIWLAVICTLLSSVAATGTYAQIAASPLTVQSLANELKSPEKIARFIFQNFRFESDQRQFGKEDYWQRPEELLANGKGDCDDFALFAAELLKANGVTAFLVNIYGHNFGHTVCVFKQDGKFRVLDGDAVKPFEAENLTDIFTKIYPFWKTAAMVNYSSTSGSGKILKTFERR